MKEFKTEKSMELLNILHGGSKMYCNSCGNSVVKGARFCQHCGTKIQQDYNNETKPKRKLLVGFNATVLIITIFLISISSGIILKAYLKGNRIKESIQLGSSFDRIAEQYERSIKLTINVLPRIISIKDINVSIVQEEEFVFPLKVEAVMSDESTKEVEVNWNTDKANTKVPGTYNYEGKVEGYEKKLHLNLTVAPKPPTAHAVTKLDKIGYIKKVYEKGTKGFLQIDEVQFLTGDAAVEAAKKDGNAGYDESTHKYFVYNDYYIVNSNPRLRDYEILSTASINMLNILVSFEVQNVANTPVSYSQFKSIINDSDAGDLCHIYIENNGVVKIEGQYVP